MHLRKYVRQIRPIQENYIKPEDKIQFLFTEEVKSVCGELVEVV